MTPIIVAAPIANKPFNGGNAWAQLSYVLGFKKLGFDAYFVEQIRPDACLDEEGRPTSPETSVNRMYFRKVQDEFGLEGRMALISADMRSIEGVTCDEILDVAHSSAMLVNISGHLDIEPLTSAFRCKTYVDLDPGFTQIWHSEKTSDFRVGGHDFYYTIGENVGNKDCLIPLDGIPWRKTRQPVVLDYWPVSREGDSRRFTTIATWRGPFGPVTYAGRTFGSKVHEFRRYAGVPGETNADFEIALNIHPADYKDRDMLQQNCWRLVDPMTVVRDPSSFHRYVQTSGAEFSVAQQMYVDTRSGWFSDRTVRYLASGKPVLVQDTGFRRNYPVGTGLLSFSTVDEAIVGVRKITDDYSEHASAARRIAEEYFDSNRVLGELLSQTLG